ncbi:MAG: DUF222 domain-containing protein [Mycobacteriales bacterium]|nr:DUF222 domain-containing protein [Mycobacteriales bacterium]
MVQATAGVPADVRVTDARVAVQAAIEPSADGLVAAADVHELLAMQAEIAAAVAARLQVVDATQTWQQTGSKAQWAWLTRHSATETSAPMSPSEARRWAKLARGLRERPAVERLLRSARISAAHATVLLTQLDLLDKRIIGTALNSPEWLVEQEQAFCDLAELTDPLVLQRELGKRLRALAPEPAAEEDRDKVTERKASLTEGFAGMWNLIGTLDPHSGQVLKAALSAWRRNDQTAGDTRSPAQRDVDALVGIATFWMARTETVTRGRGVQLVVTVPEARLAAHQSQRDLYGVPVTCPDTGARLPDPFTEPLFTRDGQLLPHTDTTGPDALPPELLGDPVPPATYPDGTAVAESTLEMLLCNATLTRVVLDQDSAVLDVGRGSRVFTHPQWLASMTQWDWKCATDGCQAPADRLELHHALWWRNGGTTDLINCAPLCTGTSSCHTRVHDGATLRLRDGRLLDQHGFRTAEPREQVWPPPLPARPPRESRTAAAASHRLHTILRPAA